MYESTENEIWWSSHVLPKSMEDALMQGRLLVLRAGGDVARSLLPERFLILESNLIRVGIRIGEY